MLDIVIPVWNYWKTTARCLASIFKGEIPIPYNIIVVNDASTDYTSSLLNHIIRGGNPIKVITNKTNMGCLLSSNIGLKSSTANYVLLLNNDIILEKNCIKKLIETIEKYPNIGLLGATQYYDKALTNPYPITTFLRGEKATIRDHIVTFKEVKNIDGDIIYGDLISFICVLMTRNTIERVGYYDERFELGCYDQEDYCLRAKEVGINIATCLTAKYYHEHGVSTQGRSDYSNALDKNRIKFFEKWGQKLKERKI